MAMDGEKLGKAIADLIIDGNAPADMKQKITKQWQDIAAVIVEHIQKNIEVTIPAGSVIVAVAGQATGTQNAAPIALDVDAAAV